MYIVKVDTTKHKISEEYLDCLADEFIGKKLDVVGNEDKILEYEFENRLHSQEFERALNSFKTKE